MTPKGVAEYLQSCSNKEFAETFVWVAKIHDLYSKKTGDKIEKTDLEDFPMDTVLEFLKNSISDSLIDRTK